MRVRSLIVAAALIGGCSLDSAGSGASDDLPIEDAVVADSEQPADASLEDSSASGDDTAVDAPSAPDGGSMDSSALDSTVDTFVPDTFVPDTFVPDTFVPDTFVPDTLVPDTLVPDAAAPCSEPNSGVYNGHCYFLVVAFSGWSAARDACVAASLTGHPAHLAVITTAGEWSFVNGLKGGGSYGRWIGLAAPDPSSKKSDFKWVTGEASAHDAWMPSHPDGSGRCVVMHSPGFTPTGSWEDSNCSASYYSVCERE